ncbi:MAG: hypothetical protein JO264_17745 [Acidisphaera sp.]|nr:hypothetical protein [Acidisphaera sp.]
MPLAEVSRLYPPGSLHAPIQDDPERAGPGGTINPETGVSNGQSGGF